MTSEGRGPRVLLVDDDAAVAKALAAMLSRAGYAVSVSVNAREAESLLDEPFDALVVDLRMPGLRGDALYYLASIRQPHLAQRTLFITGDITDSAEQIVHGTKCAMLLKPFRGEELIAAVGRLLPAAAPRAVPRAG